MAPPGPPGVDFGARKHLRGSIWEQKRSPRDPSGQVSGRIFRYFRRGPTGWCRDDAGIRRRSPVLILWGSFGVRRSSRSELNSPYPPGTWRVECKHKVDRNLSVPGRVPLPYPPRTAGKTAVPRRHVYPRRLFSVFLLFFGSIFDPIFLPFWSDFGSKNGAKINQKSILSALKFATPFFGRLRSVLGAFLLRPGSRKILNPS